MTLVLTDEYKTGILLIDEQHKHLTDLINQLNDSINDLKTKDSFDTLLGHFIDYGTFHFQAEEDYFDQYGYPDSESHKKEHMFYKEKMADLVKKIDKNKMDLAFELVEFAQDWWVYHILNVDHKYIKFFKENGLIKE